MALNIDTKKKKNNIIHKKYRILCMYLFYTNILLKYTVVDLVRCNWYREENKMIDERSRERDKLPRIKIYPYYLYTDDSK